MPLSPSTSPPSLPGPRTLAILTLLTVVAAGCIAGTTLPLGVPGEWTWSRRPQLESPWFRWPLPLTTAGLYLLVVTRLTRPRHPLRGSPRPGSSSRASAPLPAPAHASSHERDHNLSHVSSAGPLPVLPDRQQLAPPARVVVLALAACVWLLVLIQTAPPGFDLSKAGWVLYYPSSSGYFTQARHHTETARDPGRSRTAWLADYEQTVAQGDVLHLGTHPPGLVLVLQGLITLVERAPSLQSLLRATEPSTVELSFAEITRLSARPSAPPAGTHPSLTLNPLSATDRSVLWLTMLLTVVAGGATVIPLWGLLRRSVTDDRALLLAAFWPAVPSLAIFLPKSDGVFPLVACGCLWAWHEALLARTRPLGALLASLAGLLLFLGLLCSLAFLPILAAGLCLTGWQIARGRRAAAGVPHPAIAEPLPRLPVTTPHSTPGPAPETALDTDPRPVTGPPSSTPASAQPPQGPARDAALHSVSHRLPPQVSRANAGLVLACGCGTLVLLTAGFGWATGCHLPAVWRWNYQNHARFYEQFTRTPVRWLLVNPLELLLAAGPPVVGLAGLALVRNLWCRRGSAVAMSLAVAWGLVYVSGKNRGEAARLWLLLMPTLLLLAADLLTNRTPVDSPTVSTGASARPARSAVITDAGHSAPPPDPRRILLAALALQLVYALLVVSTVVGFA